MKKPSSRQPRPRVIVVVKRSALARLGDGVLDPRAEALLKSGHLAVRKWQPAHDDHERSVDKVLGVLEKSGVNALVLRGAQASFDPSGADLIVTVGGDGTLLAASHSVSGVPILGVNSAPKYSVGFFCSATERTAARAIAEALSGQLSYVDLARMQVSIGGAVRATRILNEALFCHAEPAATSNYWLRVGRTTEEQKSSGLWIGPPAGSTGALLSAGGTVLPLTSGELQFVVREPYVGDGRSYKLVHKVLSSRQELIVTSKMHHARIFLDGPYHSLAVRLGDEVRFGLSHEPLRVLGLSRDRSAALRVARRYSRARA